MLTTFTPNVNITLTSYTWTNDTITWTLVASQSFTPSTSPFSELHLFDNKEASYAVWICFNYSGANGTYSGNITTTLNNIIISGNNISYSGGSTIIPGQYIQLLSSDSILLQDYYITFPDVGKTPQEIYIVGSDDQTNWKPIQNVIYNLNSNDLQTPLITVTSSNYNLSKATVINFSYALNKFTYFRIIFTQVVAADNINIKKFYINFNSGNISTIVTPYFIINKIYDFTPIATPYITYTLSGILNNDIITLSSSLFGLYRDYNVGNNILVDISNIYLYGPNSGNYTIVNYLTSAGIINKKNINAYAANKIYDGTTNVSITLSGTINNDIVEYYAAFSDKNVGIDKTVNITLSSQIINYQISNTLSASIYIKNINAYAANKIYDGTTNVSITLSGTINNDIVEYYAAFSDKNVGIDKTVNITLSSQIIGISYSYDITNTTPYTTWGSSNQNLNLGLSLNADETRAVISCFSGYIYFSTYNGSTWSSFTQTLENTQRSYMDVQITSDGSRGVTCVGFGTDYIYTFNWNGTNYSELTQITDNIPRTYTACSMTPDGSRLVVTTNTYVYWADWDGSTFGNLTQTLDSISANYVGVYITPDKSRIIYSIDPGYIYWADWNGTNYDLGTQTLNTTSNFSRKITLSLDKSILYYSVWSTNGGPTVFYSIWNGTNYGIITGISNSSIPYGMNGWGLWLNPEGTNLYLAPYASTTYYKTTIPLIKVYDTINNYQIINDTYASIFAKYINAYAADKIYDGTTNVSVTLSGIINDDIVLYNAYFIDKNVGLNKDVYIVTISSSIVENPLDTDSYLAFHYTFDTDSINDNLLYNNATKTYDATFVNNPQIVTDVVKVGDGSLYLDHVTAQRYIQLPSNIIFTTNGLSFAFWFKFTSTGWGRVLDFGNGSPSDNILYAPGNGGGIYQGSSVITQPSSGMGGYTDNVWRHCVWTLSYVPLGMQTGIWNFYINGSLVYNNTSAGYLDVNVTRTRNYIGKSNWGNEENGQDHIDDFRMYNRVLTSDEVIQLYNYKKEQFINSNNINYQLYSNILYASIYIKTLILNAVGINKVYDKSTDASLSYTLSGVIIGDFIDISYNATFDTVNVGINKLITISDIILNDDNYYVLPYAFTSGNIYAKDLTLNAIGQNKIYDKTTVASIIYTISGVIIGDFVDISYNATFNTVNVGTNKLITISDIILNDENYYMLTYAFTSGNIYAKDLTLNAIGVDKIYDRNVNASIIYTISGVIIGDFIDISYNATFDTYNVGTNKLITISDIILNDDNYYVLTYAFTSASIFPFNLEYHLYITKLYDGTKIIYNSNITISGIFPNDNVTISSFIGSFISANAGYQIITISSIILSGTDANNYIYYQTNANEYGYIMAKLLLIYYNASSKVYDGFVYNNYSSSYNGFIIGEDELDLSGIIKYSVALNTNNLNIISVNYLIGGNKSTLYSIGYSYDGFTWYNSNNTLFTDCNKIGTDNNIWVAVGYGSDTMCYSTNGINWISLGHTTFSIVGYGINYYKNKWIAVGQGTNSIAISNDGINWSGLGENIFTSYGKSVKINKNIIVAVGTGTNTLAYSYNGNVWIGLGTDIFTDHGYEILYNNVMWIALGRGTNTIAYSYDGIIWKGLGLNIFDDFCCSGAWDGNKWIILGKGTSNSMAYSYDGINWIGLGKNIFTDFGRTITYDGTKWIASGNTVLKLVYSTDGFNWIDIINSLNFNYAITIECNKSIVFLDSDELINYGNYFIKPSGYNSNNYNIIYYGDYTSIEKTSLLVEPYSYHKIYDGTTNIDNGIFYSGFKGSDNSSNLIGTINYYTNVTPNVGTYIISISGLAALNYNINSKEGKIYITPAPLIIKVDNYVKIYDLSSYTPTYSIIGTNISVSGSIIFTGTYLNSINVGTYTIIPTGITSSNYNITFLNATLQIKQRPLFIIAKDDSRIYANDISNYTFIYTRDNYKVDYIQSVQTTSNIQSLNNFSSYNRIWTLEGYSGSCELRFGSVDNNIIIGLAEENYSTHYFFNYDNSGNIYINENQNNISYFNYVNVNNNTNNYKIKNDGTNINYYINDSLIRKIQIDIRRTLYVNILFLNKDTRVFNIQFNNIKEYYYGGNGLIYDGLLNDDYGSISGSILYGGTSQGAIDEGIYTIIPSGLTSNNYNITFITGYLNIKTSFLR